MSERVSLSELTEWVRLRGRDPETGELDPAAEGMLTLIEAVRAAEDYDGEYGHSWRCLNRTAVKGWQPGELPIVECVCGLDRLDDALGRLDFDTPALA